MTRVGADEFGEVLADGVVVQLEVLGELHHVDRASGIDEVTEDAMAGRVAERPSLLLQGRHQ